MQGSTSQPTNSGMDRGGATLSLAGPSLDFKEFFYLYIFLFALPRPKIYIYILKKLN